MIRRWSAVVLLAVGLIVVGPALAANAGPTTPAASSLTSSGRLTMKACADAPEPASPLSGLPGKLYGEPPTAIDADPFTDPGVRIADVYGYNYAWVDYDNGCVPGSDVFANAQTGIANVAIAGAASVSAFTHRLFGMVMTPSFLSPLDEVVTRATDAIKGGFWNPWVTVTLLLVGAGVLIAASRSETASAVTTAGWALLVLVGTTYVMNYPVEAARSVDSLVQTTVATSARGIGLSDGAEGSGANDAQVAVDDMFDTISRDTFYEAWLAGTLGSADSALARDYGPDLFRASHLTWSEAAVLRDDPAAGRSIVEDKKALWVQTAAAVERADSAAYQQLTGNNGRWEAAGTAVLRVGLMFPFLIVAAVFVVIAFVATRVFVPLAPGFGVLGLMYATQGWFLSVLKQVGRFVVLGPLFFVGALANLLLATATLDSDLAFPLQLVIVAGIPIVLFKLLRPRHALPGSRTMGRLARTGLSTLVHAFATKKATESGIHDAKKQADDEASESGRRDPAPYAYSYPRSGPVAVGVPVELSTGRGRLRSLPSAEQYEGPPTASRAMRVDVGNVMARPTGASDVRTRRAFAALGAGSSAEPRPASSNAPSITAASSSTSPSSDHSTSPPALPRHPAIRTDEDQPGVDLAAPADERSWDGEVLTPGIPAGIKEANRTYDSEGNEIFQIWRPPETVGADADDGDAAGGEEYR